MSDFDGNGKALPVQRQNEPLVSIILPTYNRAPFLGKAIASVLDQTHHNLELLVVDDGSTDETPSVIARCACDKRLRAFKQENRGQSVARRFALSRAQGDFIGFLDSDNIAAVDRIEKCLAYFRDNPSAGVVYGDAITIDENGNEMHRNNMRRYSGRIVPYMLRDNCVGMNTAIAKRECFREAAEWKPHRRIADDYDMWLRISADHKFYYIPEYLAYYRVMDEQISSDKKGRFDANEEILKDFIANYGDRLSFWEVRSGWCHFYSRKASYLVGQRKRMDAWREYARAIRSWPFATAPWLGVARLTLKYLNITRSRGKRGRPLC